MDVRIEVTLDETLRTLIREEFQALKQDLLTEIRDSRRPTRPEYLTTREAAQLARVTPATVREWIKIGALCERRAGQKLLVSSAELHAHLAGESVPDPEMVASRELARLGLR